MNEITEHKPNYLKGAVLAPFYIIRWTLLAVLVVAEVTLDFLTWFICGFVLGMLLGGGID